jgi:hypothetical protein
MRFKIQCVDFINRALQPRKAASLRLFHPAKIWNKISLIFLFFLKKLNFLKTNKTFIVTLILYPKKNARKNPLILLYKQQLLCLQTEHLL